MQQWAKLEAVKGKRPGPVQSDGSAPEALGMLTYLDVHLSPRAPGLAKPVFAGSVAAGSFELAPALWRNGWSHLVAIVRSDWLDIKQA